MLKGKKIIALAIATAIIFIPAVAWMAGTGIPFNGVKAGETVDGNIIRVGKTVNIEGTVNGDVHVMGDTVNVTGQVNGDVLALGRIVNVSGNVSGNVRAAGGAVSLGGQTARNVDALANKISFEKGASVGQDMIIFGGQADLSGAVGRDILGRVASASLSGRVSRDMNLEAYNRLDLSSGSSIGGKLHYSQSQKINQSADAQVGEKISDAGSWSLSSQATAGGSFLRRLVSLLGLLVGGFIVIFLFGQKIIFVTRRMLRRPWRAIGLGLAAFVICPVALAFLALSIVGLPLAAAGFAAYFTALYAAKIFASIAIGQALLKVGWVEKLALGGKDKPVGAEASVIALPLVKIMVLGTVIFALLTAIPGIGFPLALVGVWSALGGFVLAARRK
jgi:hypothetical protein